ncbi:RNA methyltransferase, partial [Xanthomonas phaseoli]|uniref:RNA methyltransferase n=1 Tax=Xanthomonas phaseoli TaxID=1985254 RepID=UPI00037056A1
MSVSQRIRFVLVGTQHPGNIGAAARAMKTMGVSRLVLVAPERALDEDAYRRSAGAEDVLGQPIFATLGEAVADCTLVMGCTARARRVALEELLPDEGAQRALAKAGEPAEVAFVFGRERTGLTNDELQLCHAAVHIPSDPQFSSLNLAAAVQVLAYEVRLAQLAAGEAEPTPAAAPG